MNITVVYKVFLHSLAVLLLFSGSVYAGTLTGNVTDSASTPIPDTELTILSPGGDPLDNTTTGMDGFYSFEIADGTYLLQVEPPASSGFQNALVQDVVVSGATSWDIVLVPSSTVMTGVLRDRDGTPLSGIEISLDGPTVITGADGSYAVAGTPGPMQVEIETQHGGTGDNYLPNNSTFRSETFTLESDMNEDINLQNRYLNLTIQDAMGNPVSDAFIYYLHIYSTEPFDIFPGTELSYSEFFDFRTTDTEGQASLAFMATTEPTTVYINPPAGSSSVDTTIHLASMVSDTTMTIVLPGTVTMTGVVRDRDGSPLAGILLNMDGPTFTTGADGSYEVVGLPGPVQMEIESQYGNFGDNYLPNYGTFTSETFTLEAGMNEDITLQNRYLNLNVQDSQGNPVPDATIMYSFITSTAPFEIFPGTGISSSFFSDFRTTDSEGHALVAFMATSESTIVTINPPEGSSSVNATLPLASMLSDTTITILLPGAVTMTGVVRDRDGSPLAGILLNLGGPTFTTGADGSYEVVGLPGPVQMEIETQYGNFGDNYLPNFSTFLSEFFTLEAGMNEDINLQNRYLNLNIQDSLGNPVPDVIIQYLPIHSTEPFEIFPGTGLSSSSFSDLRISDADGHTSLAFMASAAPIDINLVPTDQSGFLNLTIENYVPSQDGNLTVVLLSSDLTSAPEVPTTTGLLGNYPNPFNPSTTVSFALAKDSPVSINLFDIKGRLIKTLLEGDLPAGNHDAVWNGRNESGEAVASGHFFVRFMADGVISTSKILLVK